MSRALSHVVSDRARTEVFAWYTLAGSLATAMGALVAGTITRALEKTSMTPVGTYRVVVVLYALVGVLLAGFIYSAFAYGGSGFARGSVGPAEVNQEFLQCRPVAPRCDQTIQPVALGSFAGGFVVQSFAAYWFYLRFGVNSATLGVIFFWANIFAGISALLAARLAAHWGLINTMVVTHLPSNVLLILAPLMPSLWLVQ